MSRRRHVDLTPAEHRDLHEQGIEDCLVCLSVVEERLDAGAGLLADRPERPLSAYGGNA